jgi:hypothetical protein
MRFERRLAKVFNPWRLAKTGVVQLLGVWPTGLFAVYFLTTFASVGILSISMIILVVYLLFKGISNLLFAIRLKKYQKQESSY